MLFRISIAVLLVLIRFIAVIFASLHEATDLWAKAMLTLAIAAYGVALLGMLFCRGSRRANWTGFFAFGAGYLALCFGPGFDTQIMPRLLTMALVDDRFLKMECSPKRLGEKVWASKGHEEAFVEGRVFDIRIGPVDDFGIETVRGTSAWYGATQLGGIGPEEYRQLWYADLSLLFGFIGAVIASFFAARNEGSPS